MSDFDPNQPGVANGSFFALPYTLDQSSIVLVSVPWDATVSYGSGTHRGPQAIINASIQVDLFQPLVPNAWEVPVGTAPFPYNILEMNAQARPLAEKVIQAWEEGENALELSELVEANKLCAQMNDYVFQQTKELLDQGKCVGLVGGEHSTPLGFLQALAQKYDHFGILHIDAHADLRCAYEGFTFSHASIMYNALERINQVSKLVQVGIRDYCSDEDNLIQENPRIAFFPDHQLQHALFTGTTWHQQCLSIIDALPENVYISFDIDGLSAELCPHTGTPVPGGLSFAQADFLLYSLARSRKHIIGFDLCEVAPSEEDEWDANVGARILHKLCCYTYLNKKK